MHCCFAFKKDFYLEKKQQRPFLYWYFSLLYRHIVCKANELSEVGYTVGNSEGCLMKWINTVNFSLQCQQPTMYKEYFTTVVFQIQDSVSYIFCLLEE